MLVNEATFYELKRIITPVIQLQSMSRIVSELGQVLGIAKATREKILHQEQFSLRYKGFEMFFADLRWLRDRVLQFICNSGVRLGVGSAPKHLVW